MHDFIPAQRDSTVYTSTVNLARSYLRQRDFLTYASQLVPEPLGSETWSLAWGYIRHFDDMLDAPGLTKERAVAMMERERDVVELGLAGDLQLDKTAPLRHRWLSQFFDNEREFYDGRAVDVVMDLYQSAWGDVQRKGVVMSQKDMDRLLYKKARSFFKLYFILSDYDLEGCLDELSYTLGMGLGMLDDLLDIKNDYDAGYINVTREEMDALAIGLDPEDRGFLDRILEAGYATLRAKKIMSLLLRARRLARQVKQRVVRTLILRLTEIFAAPILEGRLFPGQTYFFKGGRFADLVLPSNESLAYRIGHRLIGLFLSVPQVIPSLMKAPY
jgi:hypothetical protein